MPKKVLPRIKAVTVAKTSWTLIIEWAGGVVTFVDVSEHIMAFRVYAPLRENPALFQSVRVGEFGSDVVWSDDIDMAADTLWRLAQEQSGATMSAIDFRKWRERGGLTLDAAASALGLSRRMVAYYEQGDKPIPRVVMLATRGLAGV